MKRSEINAAIDYVIQACEEFKLPLPPFAFRSPDAWRDSDEEEREIVDTMLGWDVTDFGTGEFLKTGLTVFVFRNGSYHHPERYRKPYCEKLLFVRDGQVLPFHFHWHKIEDIINRGGGDLEITLWQADEETEEITDRNVEVSMDGCQVRVKAGESVILRPGQSITLMPYQYHQWQGVPGTGDVMLFEVSMTNDDHTDNRFKEASDRIPSVEEDEPPRYLMFADYDQYVPYARAEE
ncbi:D-lyxose/D-mannose family sugar isomerase [Collinsella sp. AGMB00827]|uniref:D-lyxose ketol-isomerase n=1 Tax=Collinsella ureilytica TaxID=2869515 RepID=A0ABS7MK31_9ACTN|nr:D-lyxose/D-mannose family sugar isomerase [Collinsella urealyticum]MBY4797668.1 D-lyxose/D-mannose family sugar isomerase [Collinsella urealyticum]